MNNIFCLFPPTMVLLSSCLSCVKRFVSQVSCLWHQILQSGAQYLYHTSVRGYILFWNKQSFALVISLIGWLKDSKSSGTRSFQIPRFEKMKTTQSKKWRRPHPKNKEDPTQKIKMTPPKNKDDPTKKKLRHIHYINIKPTLCLVRMSAWYCP